eukprot:13426188-Heterocapsa_arctica.AAC.1
MSVALAQVTGSRPATERPPPPAAGPAAPPRGRRSFMALLPPGSFILIRGSTDDHWFERCALAQVEGPAYVFATPGAEFYIETIECLWISSWTWEELATLPHIYGGPPADPPHGLPVEREPVYGFCPRPPASLLGAWIAQGNHIADEGRSRRGLPPRENPP